MPISNQIKSLRSLIGTYLLQVPSVAAIIKDPSGQILLQLRSSDHQWSLPSGAIDPGETPEQAVVREVKEETGLEVQPIKLLGVFSGKNYRHIYENGDQVEYMVAVYECEIIGGVLDAEDNETMELRWFEVEEIPELVMSYPKELFR